jgi:transcriptional regulator with XRE-family HTH domain
MRHGKKVTVTTRASARRTTGKLPTIRMRSPLGLALERYREVKGLGVNELARIAGIDPAQLSRLEGGHQVTAHAATLRKLAAALDVDVDHLARLNEVSRLYGWTTDTTDEDVRETVAKALAARKIETAIESDPSIPTKRKKWLLECVALARK